MQLPVLLIGFNRPKEFSESLDNLRQVGISNLFISLDGPREKNSKDLAARDEILRIIDEIDWCNPKTNLLPKNFGCKQAVNNAISWFFSFTKFGVINEDDVLLSKDFFLDCEYFLDKYQNDKNIMSISAHSEFANGEGMTHFISPFCRVWGWATWADRWNYHLDSVKKMQEMNFIKAYLFLPRFIRSFRISAIIIASKQGRLSTWDYEWNISHAVLNSKSITPYGNYVINIGCNDPNATHTAEMDSPQIKYHIPNSREKLPILEINDLDNDLAKIIRARCQMEPLSFKGEIRSILGILYRVILRKAQE
jgi:hypothetical protein